MSKPRVIVAGAAGYVGQNLIAALGDRAEILGVDLADGFVKPAELPALSSEYDVFYNCAWRGKGGPLRADYGLQMENVKVAADFYKEALRLKCRRYVCMGTIGELMVELPECRNLRSENFIYINSKNYLHRILHAIEKPDACRIVWARLGNLYGSGKSGGNLVEYTVETLKAGKAAKFGPAAQPYDFIHARDCARALALLGLAENLSGDAYYLGNGEPRPLKEYLLRIGELFGKRSLVEIGARPDDGTRYRAEWFSIDRLSEDTGFVPEISFDDGVRALLK